MNFNIGQSGGLILVENIQSIRGNLIFIKDRQSGERIRGEKEFVLGVECNLISGTQVKVLSLSLRTRSTKLGFTFHEGLVLKATQNNTLYFINPTEKEKIVGIG